MDWQLLLRCHLWHGPFIGSSRLGVRSWLLNVLLSVIENLAHMASDLVSLNGLILMRIHPLTHSLARSHTPTHTYTPARARSPTYSLTRIHPPTLLHTSTIHLIWLVECFDCPYKSFCRLTWTSVQRLPGLDRWPRLIPARMVLCVYTPW